MRFDARKLTLAGGAHGFPREKLEPFRKAVINDKSCKELVAIVEKLQRKGIEVMGEHYKRIPRDYDPDHPRAAFLKFNGLYIMSELKLPAQIHSKGFVPYCIKEFRRMDPLQRWLVKSL